MFCFEGNRNLQLQYMVNKYSLKKFYSQCAELDEVVTTLSKLQMRPIQIIHFFIFLFLYRSGFF